MNYFKLFLITGIAAFLLLVLFSVLLLFICRRRRRNKQEQQPQKDKLERLPTSASILSFSGRQFEARPKTLENSLSNTSASSLRKDIRNNQLRRAESMFHSTNHQTQGSEIKYYPEMAEGWNAMENTVVSLAGVEATKALKKSESWDNMLVGPRAGLRGFGRNKTFAGARSRGDGPLPSSRQVFGKFDSGMAMEAWTSEDDKHLESTMKTLPLYSKPIRRTENIPSTPESVHTAVCLEDDGSYVPMSGGASALASPSLSSYRRRVDVQWDAVSFGSLGSDT